MLGCKGLILLHTVLLKWRKKHIKLIWNHFSITVSNAQTQIELLSSMFSGIKNWFLSGLSTKIWALLFIHILQCSYAYKGKSCNYWQLWWLGWGVLWKGFFSIGSGWREQCILTVDIPFFPTGPSSCYRSSVWNIFTFGS